MFMGNDPENHITLVVWANLAPDPTKGKPPATEIAKELIPVIYGGAVDKGRHRGGDPGHRALTERPRR